MKKLFLSISASGDKVATGVTVKVDEVKVVVDEFLNSVQQDFLEVGLHTKRLGLKLIFNVKNFTHNDVVSLIESHFYNYANFAVTFPTSQYSANGKDVEYYLVKRYNDYDCTLCINRTTGHISVSDVRPSEPETETENETGSNK